MPAARAPSTSASGVSPTCQVSSGRAPTSSSAARKMAPSGLAEPTSAEASAPSTSPASPVSCKRSCSDQSQLETTTVRMPAARSARSVGALSW